MCGNVDETTDPTIHANCRTRFEIRLVFLLRMVMRKTDGIVISAVTNYIPLWGKAGNFPNMEQIPALLGLIIN